MRLRRQKPKDSLDLLLDTMCNTFGGIILIAILVALLAGNRLQLASPVTSAEAEQARAEAAAELARLQKVSATLRERIRDEGLGQKVELFEQIEGLRKQLDSLKKQLQAAESALHQIETMNPEEQKAELESQLAQIHDQISAVIKIRERLENDLITGRKSLAQLQGEISSTLEESALRLHYPREHETSKNRVYVLVKYGRLYPIDSPEGGYNHQIIDWTEIGDASVAKPRTGMGMHPVRDAYQTGAFFVGIDAQSRYVAFIVSEDSFSEFRAAQRFCMKNNIEFGWQPKKASEDFIFSSSGKNPAPQ